MFAFMHLLVAWLLGKAYEKFSRKSISHAAWFFLLLGSVLPDIDFLIDWLFQAEFHRTFTHSLLFVVSSFLLLFILFTYVHRSERTVLAASVAAGITSHILLDMFFSYGVPLLWPSLLHFSWTQIGYFDPATPSFLNKPSEVLRRAMKMAILDMALGTAWIFYLWWRKRVQF